jgi:ADP-heptose:LPS heptosyltransferase
LLDVVVSVDTAVAHLAGALGKPVVILLPHAADFRWMRDRNDTPWYRSAKLVRQPAFGDWDSAIGRLADELRRIAGQKQGSPEPLGFR